MTQNKKKRTLRMLGNTAKWNVRKSADAAVFIGPSVDGTDKEYVKVLSGHVDHKKPSFA